MTNEEKSSPEREKIEELERNIRYLSNAMKYEEERRAATRRFLVAFLAGACYGVLLYMILDL